MPPWTWLCCVQAHWIIHGACLQTHRYPDKTPSHNGPVLRCMTPPPDEDCRWVSGLVLLRDVTDAELENTATLSHALLCITLVPPSTRQCRLNSTLAARNGCSSLVISATLDPPPHLYRQETHYQPYDLIIFTFYQKQQTNKIDRKKLL